MGEKIFNGDGPVAAKPLKPHRRQWWSRKKNITIPSFGENDHRQSLTGVYTGVLSDLRLVQI